MKLDFNPNLKPKLNLWATYIPTRTTKPAFSTHRIQGHAKSALGSSVGIIYEWVEGEWAERFRRDEPDKKICAGCGVPHSYRRDANGKLITVSDGQYLHGAWKKGELEYNWWCGYAKCKITMVML